MPSGAALVYLKLPNHFPNMKMVYLEFPVAASGQGAIGLAVKQNPVVLPLLPENVSWGALTQHGKY